MRRIVNKAFSNPLISGSAVIFFGTFAANIFNFMFNFFMTRNLSVVDYGTLASLISIILLVSLASESLIPTVVHFAGSYFANKEIGKVVALFWKLSAFFILSGLIVLFSSIIFKEQLGHFFKIGNSSLLTLVGCSLFFTSIGTLNRGMLTGRLSFGYISFLNFFSAVVKFLSGVVFVLLGLGVSGALYAFLLSYASMYFFSIIPLRFILRKKAQEKVIGIKKIFSYAAPSALAMLGLTLFITTDIILVKHFYSPKEAGVYAGMSLLGKIIYFFSAPISTVLFPLVVQRTVRNEKHNHLFYIAFTVVAISSIGITFFYYIFPEFSILLLLKQKEYLAIKSILWVFGVFMVFYSLLWIITNYYLSMKKTKVFFPIIAGAILQAIGLWLHHDNFLTVIIVSMVGVIVPLCIMLLYYWKINSENNGK